MSRPTVEGYILFGWVVQLRHSGVSGGCPWYSLEDGVEVTWTPCHFGGRRPWLVCSRCRERAIRLYRDEGRFLCRSCAGLNYESQHLPPMVRAMERVRKLRSGLGGGPDLSKPFPPRPTRMHRATYERLWDQDIVLSHRWKLRMLGEINRRLDK